MMAEDSSPPTKVIKRGKVQVQLEKLGNEYYDVSFLEAVIETVRDYTALWLKTDTDFHDKVYKTKLWKIVAAKMRVDTGMKNTIYFYFSRNFFSLFLVEIKVCHVGFEMREIWELLHRRYMTNRKKLDHPSGTGTAEIKKKIKWRFFNIMHGYMVQNVLAEIEGG